MISLYLLGLAGVVAVAATRMLPAARWVTRAPRLGLAAWVTVLAVVALGVAGSAASLLLGWNSTVDMVCAWWMWCAHAMTGGMGTGAGLFAWAMVVAATGIAARALVRVARTISATTARRREHYAMLTLIARPAEGLGALVVEHPQPAAYLLPGGRGQVVITSGALRQLPSEQVAAVLAHERAHATGRHHLMLGTTRALTTAFPSVAAFAHADRQVQRLVELCADDAAVAHHSRVDLARALVACAEATSRIPVPVGAAAAHGGDALERVRRLVDPPAPLSRVHRAMVTACLLVLLAAPLSIVALGQIFPFLGTCMPMN